MRVVGSRGGTVTEQVRVGRREALIGMGAAAAAGLVGAAALRDRVSVPPPGEPPAPSRPAQAPLAAATPDVRALFGTLADGAPLSTHWRVETVHAVRAGAVPV